MRHRARVLGLFLGLTALIMLTLVTTPVSGDQIDFGPKSYARAGGPPQVVSDSFTAAPGSQYKLVLTNNGLSDSATESAADSFVYLNGESIVGVSNFSQATQTLEALVTLQAENTLEVEARGAEGGSVTVQIVAIP